MKAIKSLLAVSVLVGAGAANAATSFTYTDTGVLNWLGFYATLGLQPGSVTGGGTAVLNDAGTTLTLTGTEVAVSQLGGTQNMTNTIVINGSLAGDTFTAASGSNTPLSCTGTCTYVQIGVAAPYTSVSGSITLALGGVIHDSLVTTGQSDNEGTLTFTPVAAPAVPVPAAAWLMGSGLIGLAGAARRRA